MSFESLIMNFEKKAFTRNCRRPRLENSSTKSILLPSFLSQEDPKFRKTPTWRPIHNAASKKTLTGVYYQSKICPLKVKMTSISTENRVYVKLLVLPKSIF